MKRLKGFTLLELMIAIIIFSMISLASYKLFMSVNQAKEKTASVLGELDLMQRARLIIEKDLFQIADRPILNEFNKKEPAVFGGHQQKFLIEFTRGGWKNVLQQTRSNFQRVAYALEGEDFVRYYWPVLDRAPKPVLIRQVLLTGVLNIEIKYMNKKNKWLNSWPPVNRNKNKPDQSDQPDQPGQQDWAANSNSTKDKSSNSMQYQLPQSEKLPQFGSGAGTGTESHLNKNKESAANKLPQGIHLMIHTKKYGELNVIMPLVPVSIGKKLPENTDNNQTGGTVNSPKNGQDNSGNNTDE